MEWRVKGVRVESERCEGGECKVWGWRVKGVRVERERCEGGE